MSVKRYNGVLTGHCIFAYTILICLKYVSVTVHLSISCRLLPFVEIRFIVQMSFCFIISDLKCFVLKTHIKLVKNTILKINTLGL